MNTCPYNTIRGDVTCIQPIEDSEPVGSANVEEIVTATAVKLLQADKHQKLMRQSTSVGVMEGKITGFKGYTHWRTNLEENYHHPNANWPP